MFGMFETLQNIVQVGSFHLRNIKEVICSTSGVVAAVLI